MKELKILLTRILFVGGFLLQFKLISLTANPIIGIITIGITNLHIVNWLILRRYRDQLYADDCSDFALLGPTLTFLFWDNFFNGYKQQLPGEFNP